MRSDKLVLGFDTSAAHCAAALVSGDRLLDHRCEDMAKGQAERLVPLLQEILAGAGVGWRDLGAIGVGIGPGNFTGIRISVAAARGLALALGVPAVGISALQAQACGTPGEVVSLRDARRGALYLQVVGGQIPSKPTICTASDLPNLPLPPAPICIGHASDTVATRLGGTEAAPKYPLAVATARLAGGRTAQPIGRPAPLYVRGADAAVPKNAAPPILP